MPNSVYRHDAEEIIHRIIYSFSKHRYQEHSWKFGLFERLDLIVDPAPRTVP